MKRSCAKRNLRLKMKQSKRLLKGGAGAGAGTADVKEETDDAIYFISSSHHYNFLSNFAYCRFTQDGNTFISMEQYFMYQKAKLFDETQAERILSITSNVDKDGLHFTAAKADVVLADESFKNNIKKLQLAEATTPEKTDEISKLKSVLELSETKLEEAENKLEEAEIKLKKARVEVYKAMVEVDQIVWDKTSTQTKLNKAQNKLEEATQQKLNPTSIDKNDAVIILGKYAQLLGRKVQNYDDKRWEGVKMDHMLNGLRLKFTQNTELQQRLIDTGDKTLYEANKFDGFWGIKFDIENAQKPENKSKYGKNMLGELLMVVRKELRPTNVIYTV